MSILAAFLVPHPPMIVPAVGKGSQTQIEATTRAYEQVAEEIAALRPETIVISSPHTILYSDYFHLSPGETASGSFRDFGAPEERYEERSDAELTEAVERLARERADDVYRQMQSVFNQANDKLEGGKADLDQLCQTLTADVKQMLTLLTNLSTNYRSAELSFAEIGEKNRRLLEG